MTSYIQIELDTTKPEISLYAPRYTTEDITNVITIEADEALSSYQEVYVIDSVGNRHDYTFEKESSHQYVGRVRFNTLPLGICTIYARMKDDVDNTSDLASASIELKKSITLLSLEIKETVNLIDTVNPLSSKINVVDSESNPIKTGIDNQNINSTTSTFKIEIEDFDSKEKDEVFN